MNLKFLLVQERKVSNLFPGLRLKKGSKIKSRTRGTCGERLSVIRRNIRLLLEYGNMVPFNWNTQGFRCFYCSKQIKDCEMLLEHTVRNHSTVDLKSFIPQRIITKDVPIKVNITNLSCTVCHVKLTNIDELVAHIVAIHDEKCDNSTGAGVCVFPFVLKKNFHKCVLCEDKYDNFASMLDHMYKKHTVHTYICEICGHSYVNQIRLNRHISNSHVGYRCRFCGKKFDAVHKLDKHKQRDHDISKTVKCSLCSATFPNQYRMKVHMGKIHNVEEYRIKCEHCSKVCTTKGAMLSHIRLLHSDVRFECDLCDYKTGIKWMVKLHKRKHFGEKNYICSICDRHFGRGSNLRSHMKVHTGNVGRVCRWCRHGFINTESLEKHMKTVHCYDTV